MTPLKCRVYAGTDCSGCRGPCKISQDEAAHYARLEDEARERIQACESTMTLHEPIKHEQLCWYCANCRVIWPCEIYARALHVRKMISG